MDPRQSIALFRYQVIAPLFTVERSRGALKRALRDASERVHDHPTRGHIKVGLGTLEQWYYAYKRDGLDGLMPQARHDLGASRIIDDDMAESLEALALRTPPLTGTAILAELEAKSGGNGRPMPSLSTLYRFLHARGLDDRRRPAREDHRAYCFELAGDCWQADLMYGPSLPAKNGSRRKTYLIAIIDDATRLIAHGQFYFEQHLRCFKDCLKQAFMKRGLPRLLYCDNGKLFRSRLILLIAARLGIQIIHSRPYKPEGRAKIERFFRRVREAFLARLDENRLEGLDALNRLFGAWVEGEYHVTAHRGLEGATPLDRWLACSEGIRTLPPEIDLDTLFLEETSRRVAKDGTFTFHGKTFEAGPSWIGRRITVRVDPFDLRSVLIVDPHTKHATAVFPVDLHGNRRVKRNPTPEKIETPAAPLRSLEHLAEQRERPIADAPAGTKEAR
jgi:putative transposase